jgi:hypothetical protein
MTTTSPDSLRTPDNTDAYNLVADLATLASDTQAALVKRANSYKGTATQRAAFTSAPVGTLWQDTDGNKGLYRKDTSAWVTVFVEQYGTSTERGAITPFFGQMWTDTNGSKLAWKGSTAGAWRRRSGRIAIGDGPWDSTSGSTGGRSFTVDVPTVLESGETIIVQQITGNGFFSFVSQQSVGSSSGGVTPVSFRQMQFLNLSTDNDIVIAWQLVDIPA